MNDAYKIALFMLKIYRNLPSPLRKLCRFVFWLLKIIYIRFKYKQNTYQVNMGNTFDVTNHDKCETDDLYNTDNCNNMVYKYNNAEKSGLIISWIIPQPLKGSGGHRNVYRLIRAFSDFGHKLTVYVDPQVYYKQDYYCSNATDVHNMIKENYFDLKAEIVFGVDNINECDVLFATYFQSAYMTHAIADKVKLNCYFIQDFEHLFQPMGDIYITAYQSYKLGLFPITSSKWPLNMLKKEFGVIDGDYFLFPINKEIYNIDEEKRDEVNIKVIFFARPFFPRRCYNLGISSLAIVKQKCPEVDIVLFGEEHDAYYNVPFEYNNLGLLPSINDLADLYRTAHIGVCFSTTNPSLVPFEMMACGCTVVDLDFNDNDVTYESRDNVTLAEPFPEKIAESILELIYNTDLRNKKAKSGMEMVMKLPSEYEMCRNVEKIILNRYKTVMSM